MKISSRNQYALGFLAGVAILADCSGNGSTSGYISTSRVPLGQGWLSYQAKAGKQLLFVADQPSQSVYIFPQKGKNPAPIGAITQGIAAPTGLFVDRHGTLYVCNFGAGTVTVYPKGSLSPSKTLTQAGIAPIDVVVGKDGTVYVADFNEGLDGHVFEYARASTTPTTTILNGLSRRFSARLQQQSVRRVSENEQRRDGLEVQARVYAGSRPRTCDYLSRRRDDRLARRSACR